MVSSHAGHGPVPKVDVNYSRGGVPVIKILAQIGEWSVSKKNVKCDASPFAFAPGRFQLSTQAAPMDLS